MSLNKQDYLTIGIVAVCVLAIGYLAVKLVNAAKNEVTETEPASTETEMARDSAYFEEEPYVEQPAEDAAPSAPIEAAQPEQLTPTESTADGSYSTLSSEGGDYLVLAGSYAQRANADRSVSRLKGLGYTNTRVEIFDRGKYAVVLVDRFQSLQEGRQLQQKLKAAGIDSYVKLRQGAH